MIRKLFLSAAVGIIATTTVPQSALAGPNGLFVGPKIPAGAAATLNRVVAEGQATGQITQDNLKVRRDEESGCVQSVGGVTLEEGATVTGDVESITVVEGSPVVICY